MKRIILLIIVVVAVAMSATAAIKVEVSETVELMGILAHTADYSAYNANLAGEYSKDINAWFAPYKQHKAVVLSQDIREKYGIGYERVSNMAIHLDIEKGKLKLIGERSELNNGWENVDLDDFVDKLNQFYKDTRFHEFFEQHQAFYEEGIKSYETDVMPYFHPEWYARFYGTEATEQFRIIIGFAHGDTNNGVSRQLQEQSREVFSIMGYVINPNTGKPRWDAAILIHEFNHSFVNPLLDNAANSALIEKVGQKLFQWSQPEMQNQAYNEWSIVINESIVRAAVFIYMKDNGLINKGTLNFLFYETWRRGFRWTPELIEALQTYANNRDKYPTLNDYYPEIARCLEQYVITESTRLQNALK